MEPSYSSTAAPNPAASRATAPDATAPDATAPDATAPDATAPDVSTPETGTTSTAEPAGETVTDVTGTAATEADSLAALVASIRTLWAESSRQLREVGELAFLELDLVTASLRWILWATLVLAGAVLMTWGLLLAAATATLVSHGMTLAAALLICALLNLVLAVALIFLIKSLAGNLQFRNLRQILAGGDNAGAG